MSVLDLSKAMRRVDAVLRRRQGIAEFTDDPECLVRISRAASARGVSLSGGVAIPAGAPILHIHLWNEHLPLIPPNGPTASWANLFKRRMRISLALLAAHVARESGCRDIVAITASPAFPDRLGPLPLTRLCEHFGWEVIPSEPARGLRSIHARLDSLLIWGLILAFNPGGLRGRGLSHRRIEVWMSRSRLLERHGSRHAGGDIKTTMVEPS